MKACRLNPKTKLLCESGTLKTTTNEIAPWLFDSVSVFTQWMNQLKTSVLNQNIALFYYLPVVSRVRLFQ
jgi:hypothetical protein